MSRFCAVTSAACGRAPSRRVLSGLAILLGASSLVLLSGCSATPKMNLGSSTESQGASISGKVFGGQQPVTGATVTLYAVGTGGYASAPTQLAQTTTGTTGSNAGFFTIPSYTCPAAPGDQTFLLATGGTPGGVGGANPNLAQMAALGSCNATGFQSQFVVINEVTTVASAYALSQFLTYSSAIDTPPTAFTALAVPNIGIPVNASCTAANGWKSTGPNTCNYIGLENAMATVQNIVCLANGNVPPDSIPYSYYLPSGTASCATGAGDTSEGHTGYVPSARINTMASALASCVNSTGGTHGGAASNCNTLFTALQASNGAYPADTLEAILTLAQNPQLSTTNGNNFFALGSTTSAVFDTPTVMTAVPNDWTIVLGFTAGGFINYAQDTTLGTFGQTYSTGMAIDQEGNIWATSVGSTKESATSTSAGPGGIVGLQNNGVPISPNSTASAWGGFQANVSRPRSGPAIDLNGDIWFGNFGNATTSATLAAVSPTGSSVLPAPVAAVTDGYIQGLAADAAGNVWVTGVTGTNSGSLQEFSIAGVPNTSISTFTYPALPAFNNVAVDQHGNVWLTTNVGDAQVTASTGALANQYGDLNYGQLAVNSSGDVFGCDTANIYEDELSGSTYTPIELPNSGGCYEDTLYAPIALDGLGRLWSTVVEAATVGTTSVTASYLSEVSGSSSYNILSPATYGYTGIGAQGGSSDGEMLGVFLLNNGPYSTQAMTGTAVDQSGNVWVLNGYTKGVASDELVEFVGLGAPTVQPTALALKYNTLTQLP